MIRPGCAIRHEDDLLKVLHPASTQENDASSPMHLRVEVGSHWQHLSCWMLALKILLQVGQHKENGPIQKVLMSLTSDIT